MHRLLFYPFNRNKESNKEGAHTRIEEKRTDKTRGDSGGTTLFGVV